MEGTFTVEYMVANGAVLRCTACHETYGVLFGETPICPMCSGVDNTPDYTEPELVDDFTDHHYFNPIDQGRYDDDPSPYDGTYSEE
jgi:hypothetical protein